jgi:hypothetical protein
MYLAKILTKRLAESNVQRSEEFTSGMSGDLSHISAAELLQALDLSQKTGMLALVLPRGSANLLLKSGHLIRAEYCDKTGKKAVYEILKEKEGRFNFSPNLPEDQLNAPKIGSLMEILLDTSRIIDEEACDEGEGSPNDAVGSENIEVPDLPT